MLTRHHSAGRGREIPGGYLKFHSGFGQDPLGTGALQARRSLLQGVRETRYRPRTEPGAYRTVQVRQVMVRGMVAWTVVFVLTFFLPFRVVTISVTSTLTELVPPVSFLLGVPDSTPVFLESFSRLGRLTFFHFRVVL